MSWRDKAAPIIADVIARVGRDDMGMLRKELRDAYPWGPRRMHPYKIWCDEINRQIGRNTNVRLEADGKQGDMFWQKT